MPRSRSYHDLTTTELRQLLMERQRADRMARLATFRRTGRIIRVEPIAAPPTLDDLGSQPVEDEIETDDLPEKRKPRILDRVLIAVEVLAVLGLVFIVWTGFNVVRSLNAETTGGILQPGLTPTPLIVAVVLPGGHTPPNAPGGVQPNDAEIPEHLRPLVQSVAALPTPAPSAEQAERIQIPALGLDAPIVVGDGWEQLKKGVGQNVSSVNPGQTGNLILSAHNDIFGELFRDLDKLNPGDEVIVYTSQRAYVYIINQTQVVEPTRVDLMAQTQEPVVTLISCYPYMVDNQRIVVTAILEDMR